MEFYGVNGNRITYDSLGKLKTGVRLCLAKSGMNN
jgi:hypothetical protein